MSIVKLYDRKHAIIAADMLNDKVIPWYEEQDVPLLRMLTDRGSEYCGNREHHEFELYLDLEGVEHTRTKATLALNSALNRRPLRHPVD